MISEILNIFIKILKLDKNFFKNKKNFEEAAIYFAVLYIIIISIIKIIPNSTFLEYMSFNFNLGKIQGPSLRSVIIISLIMWVIKATYLFFLSVIVFPEKKTKCDFRKILILVSFCQIPLILNIFIFNQILLFLVFVTYIWYNISLIIGLKIFLDYKSYIKTSLIALAPQILFLLYVLSIFQTTPNLNFS